MIRRAPSARPPAPRAALPPLLLALLALAGCASTTAPKGARTAHAARPPAPEEPPDDVAPPEPRAAGSATPPASGPVYQRGVATYYADKFTGRPTATGEPYNPNELTAAHRTLPLGAVVDVARADGRHVTVRINDRGPYGKNRIIDLSRRAAHAIGLLDDGVAKVLLRVVSMPEKRRRRHR